MKIATSILPWTRLTVFSLATVSMGWPQISHGTGNDNQAIDGPVVDVPPQLARALLSPMSGLIRSPYADRKALENTLGTSTESSADITAIRSAISGIPLVAMVHDCISEGIDRDFATTSDEINVSPLSTLNDSNSAFRAYSTSTPIQMRAEPALAMTIR